jgi:hypothetical protein
MRINRKNAYFYWNYAFERWKDVNTNKKDASVFYSSTYFLSRIMKINEKNAYFYGDYALERWINVYSSTKNALIFIILLRKYVHE